MHFSWISPPTLFFTSSVFSSSLDHVMKAPKTFKYCLLLQLVSGFPFRSTPSLSPSFVDCPLQDINFIFAIKRLHFLWEQEQELQQTNNEVSPGCDTLLPLVQNKFHFHHFLFTLQELCHETKKRDYQDRFVFLWQRAVNNNQILLGSCYKIPNNIIHLLKQAFLLKIKKL